MTRARTDRWRNGSAGDLGHVLSVFAILCQLFGVSLLPAVSAAWATDDPLFTGVICHADIGTGSGPQQAPIHHPSDCALCPACLAASLLPLSPAPPLLPAPVTTPAAAVLPPTRAGPAPSAFRLAAQARAPPPSV